MADDPRALLAATRERLVARHAMPCGDCTDTENCACCAVDAEFIRHAKALEAVLDVADQIDQQAALLRSLAVQVPQTAGNRIRTAITAALTTKEASRG